MSESCAARWTVGHQAPLSIGFQERILGWVAISFSRWSSWHRDQTWISRIAGRLFYHLSLLGRPRKRESTINMGQKICWALRTHKGGYDLTLFRPSICSLSTGVTEVGRSESTLEAMLVSREAKGLVQMGGQAASTGLIPREQVRRSQQCTSR